MNYETMIKQLKIQNFQSHKDSVLEFDPGVNIIVGTSDSGKTAIIRALRWAVWNRPGGDAFRSHWGGDTVVKVITDAGSIVRQKGKENSYIINNKEELKAFGTEVPEEVRNILNLNEINLQEQMDSPFLLSNAYSPGAVAGHFNQVAHLDLIDSSISDAKKDINKIKTQQNQAKESKASIQEKLKSYEQLDFLEVDLEMLEQMEQELTSRRSKETQLKNIVKEIDSLSSSLRSLQKWQDIGDDLDPLLALYDSKKEKETYVQQLKELNSNILTYTYQLQKASKIVKAENEIHLLIAQQKEHENKRTQYDQLDAFLEEIVNMLYNEKQSKEKYQELHIEFSNNYPDICPFCSTPLNKNHATNQN